jgi:hypothetical protein
MFSKGKSLAMLAKTETFGSTGSRPDDVAAPTMIEKRAITGREPLAAVLSYVDWNVSR